LKIILSRKGFDSSYGGIPSPIFQDGRLVSFPIPSPGDYYTFADLHCPGIDMPRVLTDLSGARFGPHSHIHLDPDLDRRPTIRPAGWRPALGQTGAAQSHLAGQGVGPGDIFLFFGWFRAVEQHHGAWRYTPGAPHLHVIFGWLEVDEVLPIVTQRKASLTRHPWIASHPHMMRPEHYNDSRNTIYIARDRSMLSAGGDVPGGGAITHFHPRLQLTAPGATRSRWTLPRWFAPSGGRPPLTYHGNLDLWSVIGDQVHLRSAAKGQEFVLDTGHYPEAVGWLVDLIGNTDRL
jgi:putative DNA base modification enzyme with NMAD domain